VLAAAVGIYLPLDLTVPIFLGGLLTYVVEKVSGHHGKGPVDDRIHQKGVLFSAGLITGEALMGIIIAVPIVVSGSAEVLALPASLQFGNLLGVAIFAAIGYLLYRVAVAGARDTKL
jgi:hypothetical protein